MGLLRLMEAERRIHMEKGSLDLTAPEAAVALAALVSFSDDEPSEAEGVVLRRFYRYTTAESLQGKLAAAGYKYPTDLPEAEETIVRAIGDAPHEFKVRTLAVAWLLALADGHADQSELRLLCRYAEAMSVSLAEVRHLADSGIHEVDETTEDEVQAATLHAPAPRPAGTTPALNPDAAGVLLACWVGFSDDDPSDAEAAVVREHFGPDLVEGTLQDLTDWGFPYPESLPQFRVSIATALSRLNRDEQTRMLAIALRVAEADGQVKTQEEAILKEYCEELSIGIAELRTYFKTSEV
jgi:tellurite resistance protein